MSVFSKIVVTKILTTVSLNETNISLLYQLETPMYSHGSLQHRALFALVEEHCCHTGSEQGGSYVATAI